MNLFFNIHSLLKKFNPVLYAIMELIWLIFLETAEALASQVTQEHFDKGLIYPPFKDIRKISAHIAANVAAKSYELGNAFLIYYFLPF